MDSFYKSENMSVVSLGGYYPEKINVFCKQLSEIQKARTDEIKILDIGCNDGYLTNIYSKYGKAFGIDINPQSLKKAKKYKHIEFIEADVSELVTKYKSHFDVIIGGDIIEHVFETDKFLRSIHTLLKKDGILLLTTPNLASLGRRLYLLFGFNPFIEFSTELPYKNFNVGHIRYYTLANLVAQLNHCDFRLVHVCGDRIPLSNKFFIPFTLAQYVPKISRNFIVVAQKK